MTDTRTCVPRRCNSFRLTGWTSPWQQGRDSVSLRSHDCWFSVGGGTSVTRRQEVSETAAAGSKVNRVRPTCSVAPPPPDAPPSPCQSWASILPSSQRVSSSGRSNPTKQASSKTPNQIWDGNRFSSSRSTRRPDCFHRNEPKVAGSKPPQEDRRHHVTSPAPRDREASGRRVPRLHHPPPMRSPVQTKEPGGWITQSRTNQAERPVKPDVLTPTRRKHLDKQGFVFVSVLSRWNKPDLSP